MLGELLVYLIVFFINFAPSNEKYVKERSK